MRHYLRPTGKPPSLPLTPTGVHTNAHTCIVRKRRNRTEQSTVPVGAPARRNGRRGALLLRVAATSNNGTVGNQSAINVVSDVARRRPARAGRHFPAFRGRWADGPSELTALQAAIAAYQGQRIVPVEFLALLPSFAATALTDEQAEAAGWFAEAGE